MIFNSLVFVVFFAIVLILHSLPFSLEGEEGQSTDRKLYLLCGMESSLRNPAVAFPPWSTGLPLVAWPEAENPWKRRAWMLVSIVVSLGLLSYFKYGQFALENFAHLAALAGFHYAPPKSSIVPAYRHLVLHVRGRCPTRWIFTCDEHNPRAASSITRSSLLSFRIWLPGRSCGPDGTGSTV